MTLVVDVNLMGMRMDEGLVKIYGDFTRVRWLNFSIIVRLIIFIYFPRMVISRYQVELSTSDEEWCQLGCQ